MNIGSRAIYRENASVSESSMGRKDILHNGHIRIGVTSYMYMNCL